MREASIVDADFFRAPITVVVEDQTTRAFLSELWDDTKITIRLGAGRAGVEAIAKGAAVVAQRVVVGLVDLDFSTPNQDRWEDRTVAVLRLNRHEIENYLLDWNILAEMAGGEASELEQKAASQARRLVWWMACKRVLHLCSRDLMDGFVSAPKVPPDGQAADQASAISYLKQHPFWKSHREMLQRWQPGDIETRVNEEGQRYEQDCDSGRWIETFSGKELLGHLRAVTPMDHAGAPGVTPAQREEDLARRGAQDEENSQNPGGFPAATRGALQESRPPGIRAHGLTEWLPAPATSAPRAGAGRPECCSQISRPTAPGKKDRRAR